MRNPKVEAFFAKTEKWHDEMQALREIALYCGLVEEFKWGQPCYMYHKTNLLLIYNLKDCAAMSFMKGALLSDSEGILLKPGENSNHAKWAKFTDLSEIEKQKTTLQAYIYEAIEVEKAGLKVVVPKEAGLDFPEELLQKFEADPAFKAAFEALTPGRQRGYNLYFNGAKQAATRVSRIENYVDRIMSGKGFHDCVCGLSKKMPTCDGSHKFLKEKV